MLDDDSAPVQAELGRRQATRASSTGGAEDSKWKSQHMDLAEKRCLAALWYLMFPYSQLVTCNSKPGPLRLMHVCQS